MASTGSNGGSTAPWDELAGEFDYIYQPLKAKMVDQAIALNGAMRTVKRKLQHKN